MAFMFETCYTMKLTKNFMHDFGKNTEGKDVDVHKSVDDDYHKCWQGLERLFNSEDIDAGRKK